MSLKTLNKITYRTKDLDFSYWETAVLMASCKPIGVTQILSASVFVTACLSGI